MWRSFASCPAGWLSSKSYLGGGTSSPLCKCCVESLWPCKQHKQPRISATGDPAALLAGSDVGGLHIQATDFHKQQKSRSRRCRQHKRLQLQTGLQCP